MMPHRKLPHVGMNLPDMDERSMPEQPGMTWQDAFAEFARGFRQGFSGDAEERSPIRVQAEVGEAL